MADAQKIFVVDRLEAKPGLGETLFRRYMAEYAPVATARGFTLVHRWVSPPVWLGANQSNSLTFVWSVDGVAGYWDYVRQARTDPGSGDWWLEIAPLVIERTRTVASEMTDMESLADV